MDKHEVHLEMRLKIEPVFERFRFAMEVGFYRLTSLCRSNDFSLFRAEALGIPRFPANS